MMLYVAYLLKELIADFSWRGPVSARGQSDSVSVHGRCITCYVLQCRTKPHVILVVRGTI